MRQRLAEKFLAGQQLAEKLLAAQVLAVALATRPAYSQLALRCWTFAEPFGLPTCHQKQIAQGHCLT